MLGGGFESESTKAANMYFLAKPLESRAGEDMVLLVRNLWRIAFQISRQSIVGFVEASREGIAHACGIFLSFLERQAHMRPPRGMWEGEAPMIFNVQVFERRTTARDHEEGLKGFY